MDTFSWRVWVGITIILTVLVFGLNVFFVRSFSLSFGVLSSLALWCAYGLFFYEFVQMDQQKSDTLLCNEQLNLQTTDLDTYYLAVEHAFDAIVIVDPNGVIVHANHALENLTGYTREEIIGKTPDLWQTGSQKESAWKQWQSSRILPEPMAYETTNHTAHGKPFTASVRCSPVFSLTQNLVFFVLIIEDITQEKELDRTKGEFVSLASHQLRTPLTAILWYADMLVKNEVGPLLKSQSAYVEKIDASAKRMSELISSLLNVSRVELGKMRIEPVLLDLRTIADEALQDVTHRMEEKHHLFKKTCAQAFPLFFADPHLMRVIFQNLLSNAIKYTPEHGSIHLLLGSDETHITIRVRDTGYGIPQEQQKKIFTKMFRADNIQQVETDGTGLGLYLVKMILDEVGGTVSFVSEEGKGTEFCVRMPKEGWVKQTEGEQLDS